MRLNAKSSCKYKGKLIGYQTWCFTLRYSQTSLWSGLIIVLTVAYQSGSSEMITPQNTAV